jgi:hypothetical protein
MGLIFKKESRIDFSFFTCYLQRIYCEELKVLMPKT